MAVGSPPIAIGDLRQDQNAGRSQIARALFGRAGAHASRSADIDWQLDDPHGQPLERVREIRDEIDRRVRELAAELDRERSVV
jgi:protein-tyrosine-phosphatase